MYGYIFFWNVLAFIIAESCDAERLKISLMMISSALEEDVIV